MAMALYSPEDVVILLGGFYQLEGLHDGSFLSISDEKVRWETSVTADGSVSRTNVTPAVHTISITLSSVSSSNSILTTWATADSFLYGAILPLIIKDMSGSTMFYTTECWIEKVADTSFDTSVTGREWILKSAGGSLSVGGNSEGGVPGFASLGLLSSAYSTLV